MKKILVYFIVISIAHSVDLNNKIIKTIIDGSATYQIVRRNVKVVVEKTDKNQSLVLAELKNVISEPQVFITNKNIYILHYGLIADLQILCKIKKDSLIGNLMDFIVHPIRTSPFYDFDYSINNERLEVQILGNQEWIKKTTNHTQFFYQDEKELWIPLNDNNEEIYEDACSAIKNWFYDGNLKRWYPENDRGEIDKEIWFEQTPTTELRNYPQQLLTKHYNGEKINFSEKFKEKIAEERERLNVEEEKRIAEEKQKLQQKIFIILGILFLVIFGGFLIKRLKNKKMKRRMKLSQIQ